MDEEDFKVAVDQAFKEFEGKLRRLGVDNFQGFVSALNQEGEEVSSSYGFGFWSARFGQVALWFDAQKCVNSDYNVRKQKESED